VLRTALGLSLVTGTAFRIVNLRGGREKPGLLRQHLTCVQAAQALGGADVEGAELSSRELVFRPNAVQPGRYEFSIGSAGSTTLVLQAVLPALLRASGPTTLSIEGGTHNGLAPPFDFLARSFVPVLTRMGAKVDLRLVRPGFEPAGGGRLEVTVTPAPLTPVELLQRGALRSRSAIAVVSAVARSVAERELAVVREELEFADDELRAEELVAPGPGNSLAISLEYEHVTEVFVGLGARGVTAEKVARRTCGEVRRALRTDAPVGLHLADQLLIPFALAGGGVFRTVEPTLHTRTQLELIPRFLDVKLGCQPEAPGATWRVSVG
jgi:RNA 3'-terminal phosphate cyclase (ATP)